MTIKRSEKNSISEALFLNRVEIAIRENPQLTLKDLCVKGLCPLRVQSHRISTNQKNK